MREIELDGTKLLEKDSAQKYLKEIFGFGDDYGNNLDALNDALYDVQEDITIHITSDNLSIMADSDYAYKILSIINDVCSRKRNLNISFMLDE